ncbi:MAG: septum formation initiator family protein [Calditrichaeota bacterium]|nr:MAG: septum formation initiator family protein [Calditrichota bacterium]
MIVTRVWKRRLWILAALATLAFFGFGGRTNLLQLWKFKQERKALEDQLRESEKQREALRLELQKLKDDSTYIEKVARERFRMGKKGEKVYLFDENKKK